MAAARVARLVPLHDERRLNNGRLWSAAAWLA
jgi:hypothetical protein